MTGRPEKSLLDAVHCEAQCMIDDSRCNLVVAYQTWENGQARGIGRGPVTGTQCVRIQTPDGPAARFPASIALGIARVHFVEFAGATIDYDHMAVTAALSAALDWCKIREETGGE